MVKSKAIKVMGEIAGINFRFSQFIPFVFTIIVREMTARRN